MADQTEYDLTPPRVGDPFAGGTVRTVEALDRPGHYRITFDVDLSTPPEESR